MLSFNIVIQYFQIAINFVLSHPLLLPEKQKENCWLDMPLSRKIARLLKAYYTACQVTANAYTLHLGFPKRSR